MDRYQRVEKPKQQTPIKENEIRITAQGFITNYVSYGISLIQDKRANEITLNGMGQAISKAVAVAEILKKQLSAMSLTDIWEPIEEGLVPVETTRQVSIISITLSTKELNKNSPGYQAPNLAGESVSHSRQQQLRQARASYNPGYGDSYGQRRGRGRGRGQGRGEGYDDYYQDTRGYSNNWEHGHTGRGRNSYQQGNHNRIAYDQGYDGGYDRSRGGQGDRYEKSRGGYEHGGQGGGFDRGRGSGYVRGRGGGGYERSQGGGGYERGRGGSAYETGRGGGGGYESYGGWYERERGGGYARGQGGGYERNQGGGYERGRGGYARGRGGGYEQGEYEVEQGAGYERGRGGYGRVRGRAGGHSRGGGY